MTLIGTPRPVLEDEAGMTLRETAQQPHVNKKKRVRIAPTASSFVCVSCKLSRVSRKRCETYALAAACCHPRAGTFRSHGPRHGLDCQVETEGGAGHAVVFEGLIRPSSHACFLLFLCLPSLPVYNTTTGALRPSFSLRTLLPYRAAMLASS